MAEETRQIDFVISDESRDRHGTIIPLNAWKLQNFNANGIVGYQHDVYGDDFLTKADPDDVIGIGEAFTEDGKLIGRVTFEPAEINPKAEKIFQKVLHGTLKATSVGFYETKKGAWGEKEQARDGATPTYFFGEVELLEFSIVNIPSNPAALRRKLEEKTLAADLEETRQQLSTAQLEIASRDITIASLKQNLRIAKMRTAFKGQ
ncbi:MAG: HK97 family phage prohead protease [Desulfobulbaceae bacterium]|nr:HK97 family phage prohead protease [Desulfobulbaceae bacterium]